MKARPCLDGSSSRRYVGRQVAHTRSNRKNRYTAIVKQDGEWWIGWIEEVPGVNCQERTRESLLDSLSVALREALAFNRDDAIEAAGVDYEEFELAV